MGGFGAADIFEQMFGGGFFGGGGRRRRRGPPSTEDMRHVMKVKLEDLYNSKTKKIAVKRSVICNTCDGKGGSNVQRCSACNGQGITIQLRQIGPGMVQQLQAKCRDCRGTGEKIRPADRCNDCSAEGVTVEKKVLKVEIDKGMSSGEKLVFRGESDQAPGHVPGDVIIILEQEEHPVFTRQGDDLVMTKDLTLVEALCGFQFSIQHLDERVLLVSSEPGQVIKPGDTKCILSEGMPRLGSPFSRGRLYIKFNVIFPEQGFLSPDNARALEALLPPRPAAEAFDADNVEEVHLHDYEQTSSSSNSRSRRGGGGGAGYYEEDEDDYGGGGAPPGVSCAQQ